MSGTDSEAARDPCAQLERELDGVWDEDLREKLNGKILSIEEPWAEHAAQQTTEQLDEHAGQWLEARSDLCQARRELGEAAAALQGEASCLRRQRLETKALVRLLQEGDESLVKKSVEIVHRLEPASRCADLGQKEELPPEGPQLEAIEAELAQGRAEVAATQWTAAIESFGRAGRAAEAVGAGSLQRQAELREALAHEGKNEHLAAEQGLHEVAAQSLRAGEVERAAHAWAELVGIVGFRLGRAEEALRWASYAREALKDLDRPDLQVRLEHGQALVAYGAGRYGEAQAAFERGLTHYPDPKSPQAANVLNNLGAVAFARGEYQASLDYHQRALAIWRAKFGDRHPDVAISYNNIGSVYEMQGELERAREMLETAMKIRVESLGPESEGVAMGHFNLGVLEEQEGQLERALEHQERAVKIWTQHLGPEHPKVTTARTARGRAYLALGRYEEALADLRMAQAQREGKKEDPIDQAETLFALGRAEVEVPGLGAKERSAGREHIARALAILEEDPELAPDFLKEVRAYPLP